MKGPWIVGVEGGVADGVVAILQMFLFGCCILGFVIEAGLYFRNKTLKFSSSFCVFTTSVCYLIINNLNSTNNQRNMNFKINTHFISFQKLKNFKNIEF